ncbi:hypothetical protein DFH07DRAFT_959894 [Mycena maculata]|uniref:MULE transposase domain-containing protein n=1 Tax=Mycena maculata TaxID=230809 RepID=A0AAD7NC89_9AGAR|nr:hypothetical protein DFH07DRAFT_959894 [Mycena maculata]
MQTINKPKKHDETDKHRTSRQMECFDCDGWLHITVSEESTEALVRFKHELDHIPYCSIDVPLPVKEFVAANPCLTTMQYQDRTKILFSRHSIYTLWVKTDCEKWKLDDDELESAIKIIQRAAAERTGTHEGHPIFRAEPIVLPAVDGFSAVVFALPSVWQKWGGQIREIAMDSAWETNKSQFELFAFIGELSMSGCPLAYLLIKSEKNSTPNSQQKYLKTILMHLQNIWGLRLLTTLSDKYWPEINACWACASCAKHQLCFWHAIRAVKKRLAILKRWPAHYNVLQARLEFPAIDAEFVPIGQDTNLTPKPRAPTTTIPFSTIRLQGVVVNPPPIASSGPMIVLNRTLYDGTPVSVAEEEEDENDAEDLGDDVEEMIRVKEPERTNLPDYMCEAGENSTHDPDYVVCPAAHRAQLLRLFTRHFCQHPFFPGRNELHPIGQPRGTYNDVDGGSISDGDDVVWSGDKTVLTGGLRRDVGRGSLLGKRVREDDNAGRHIDGNGSQTPRLDGQGDASAAFGEAHSDDEDDERPSTARLVRSIRLSTIRLDHNYQILALCPQVQIVVQPDEVSVSMEATFATLDPYRKLALPQFSAPPRTWSISLHHQHLAAMD